MPKANKQRKKISRVNPLARKNESKVSENTKVDDGETRQKTVLPLVQKLSSGNANERAEAIGAVNTLVDNPNVRRLLLKEKIVHTVMKQSITDSDQEVVSEAYGLLRNLVLEEGSDLAIFLFRQDILTAIKANLGQWSEKYASCSDDKSKELMFVVLENVLCLVSALASTTDDIFDAIHKQLDLAPTLLEILDVTHKAGAHKAYTAATEALYVLSQEPEFINKVASCPVDRLLTEEFPELSRVYINGLKFNAIDISGAPDHDALLKIMEDLVPLVSNVDAKDLDKAMDPTVDNDDPVDIKKVNSIAADARSKVIQLQTGLELFAEIAEALSVQPQLHNQKPHAKSASQDGHGEGDDDEEMEEDEDDEDEDALPEFENDIDFDREYDESDEDPAVSFLHTTVLPLLARRLGEPMFQLVAVMALNNACWTIQLYIPTKSTKWAANAEDLWTNLLPMLDSVKDIDVLSGIVGSLWAVAKAFEGKVPIDQNQIRNLILFTNSEECKKQGGNEELMINIVGLLVCIGMNCGDVEKTREVSDFFMSIVASPTDYPAAVLVDVINALFDLYGDASYTYDEPLFVRGGLLNVLQQSLPKVRQAIKKVDKNKDKLLRERGDEAVMNLGRFVDYKRKERK